MVKNTIAIIPARGNSKRIANKNIVDFFGQPLIAHTIKAALDSKLFSQVVVSTDSQEIADIAVKYGAIVRFLRTKYADDNSPISVVTLDALERIKQKHKQTYSVVCQLMPNCPLRTCTDIKNALNYFEESGAEFQISCFKFGWMNPWWAHQQINQKLQPLFDEQLHNRSQDQPDLYAPTGAVWLAKIQALEKSGTFYGPDYNFFPLSWQSAVDIDDKDDLEIAKMVYALRKQNHE